MSSFSTRSAAVHALLETLCTAVHATNPALPAVAAAVRTAADAWGISVPPTTCVDVLLDAVVSIGETAALAPLSAAPVVVEACYGCLDAVQRTRLPRNYRLPPDIDAAEWETVAAAAAACAQAANGLRTPLTDS